MKTQLPQLERVRKALAEALEEQGADATVGVNALLQIACSVAVLHNVPLDALIDTVKKWFDYCERAR